LGRNLDLATLITVPRLDAAGAVALGNELLAAAEAVKKLPPPVEKARVRLRLTVKELAGGLQRRLGQPEPDPARTRAADSAEDNAFVALYYWLDGFSRLPDSYEEAATARALSSVLFPDGLKFTKLPYKQEWAEADARLSRMTRDGLDQQILGLGGGAFIKNLQTAHKDYGEALGITAAPKETAPKTSFVREPFNQFIAALRPYVLRVLAYVDDEHPETAELAEALLAPLARWHSRPARPALASDELKAPPARPGASDGTAERGVDRSAERVGERSPDKAVDRFPARPTD